MELVTHVEAVIDAMEAALVAERFAQGKVAVGGRRGFELPSLGQGSSGPGDLTLDRDFEMNSTLDVPAFLRKQEG